MVSPRDIYALKLSCIVVPFIQDFPTQEELARHAPDKLPLTVHGSRQVFTIPNISLDNMVPWISIDLDFNIHEFFDVYAVGRHAADLYAPLSHIISFYQLNHASQGR